MRIFSSLIVISTCSLLLWGCGNSPHPRVDAGDAAVDHGRDSQTADTGADIRADAGVDTAVTVFQIGGAVSGLTGAGLVLENNAGDTLSLSTNGAFAFATSLPTGAAYAVTVK